MNANINVRSIVVAAVLMSFSSGVLASGASSAFQSRIEKQAKAVEAARKAKEINVGESKSLKKEIQAIIKLYEKFLKDKTISPKEAKLLNAKLNNSDVNLFRKKYD